MRKQIATAGMLVLGGIAFGGAPIINPSSVTMTQDDDTRRVTINYKLEEAPAVVTVDIRTNGVSIGAQNLQYFAGDVNKIVAVGDRSINWKPDKAWPGHKIASGVTAVVTAWATNTPPNYMVVSLMTPKSVQFYTDVELIPYGVSNDMYKTEYLVMRKIPAGNVMWRKGSPSDEIGRKTDEATYQVTLSDDFYLGVYPVTQRQYQLMTGLRPSAFSLDSAYATRPVEQVSYESLRGTAGDGYDWPNDKHKVVSTGFIHLLRAHSGLNGFDLPTAAQWEFACRAGCGSAIYNGKNLDDKDRAANLVGVARYKFTGGYLDDGATAPTAAQRKTLDTSAGTNKVGSYEPNAFGLYDMLGNTFEWCLDWYASSVSGTNPETGPLSGEKRELKSGDWQDPANFCRAASRMSFAPNGAAAGFGFRMACSVGLQ